MRRASLLTLAFLAVASLACGGLGSDLGGVGGGYSLPEADLTAPWDGMNLPIEGGKCFSSSDAAVSFQYTDGTKQEHFDRYVKHFESDGWETVTSDSSGATLVTVFRKDADQVAVSALEVLDNVSVTLGMTRL